MLEFGYMLEAIEKIPGESDLNLRGFAGKYQGVVANRKQKYMFAVRIYKEL